MIVEFDKNISRIFGRKFFFEFEISSNEPHFELTIDIYPVENPSHPDRHFAYWVFERVYPGERYRLNVDLNSIRKESVSIYHKREEIYPQHFWANEAGFYEPVLDFQFVLRRDGRIRKIIHSHLIAGDTREIENFYTHDRGGEYRIDTLNLVFHNHRMKLLKRLFNKHLKDNEMVLDAGSGVSIFSLLYEAIPFKVFAVDLKFQGAEEKKDNIFYIKANVEKLPFKNNFFDFSYSGEVIEHIYSPLNFLKEISRVTKPDGIFVITTPNAERLINRVRGFRLPLSAEHVNEMNLAELEKLLEQAGFEVLEKKGIYIELFLNYLKSEDTYDIIQSKLNKPFFKPIMKILMKAGEYFPQYALDLIIVSKKI